MSNSMRIECGPADNTGRRLVVASCGRQSHRDRFDTDDAFRRRRFAEAAAARFGWETDAETQANIDAAVVRAADHEDQSAAAADSVCLASVAPSDVRWLWPGRVALGKLTLLAGDPGLGKSFVTLDIAARVSRGTPWPDEPARRGAGETRRQGDGETGVAGVRSPSPPLPLSPSSVVLLSAEDDLADTIRPRLEAHGADCRRIVALRAVGRPGDDQHASRWFDLGTDLAHLEQLVERLGDCRLVVIDPISAYLGRNVENANAELRSLLAPLATLAAERELAVLLVSHLRKGEGAAIYRTLGSMALVAACRTAWVVCRDRDRTSRRLLLPVKNNLASDTGGLAYSIEPLGMDDAPAVCWSPERVDVDVNEALAPPSRPRGRPADSRHEAEQWLADRLASGPEEAAQMYREGAHRGFSESTCRRALAAIGGEAIRHGSTWSWHLPPGPDAHREISASEVSQSDF